MFDFLCLFFWTGAAHFIFLDSIRAAKEFWLNSTGYCSDFLDLHIFSFILDIMLPMIDNLDGPALFLGFAQFNAKSYLIRGAAPIIYGAAAARIILGAPASIDIDWFMEHYYWYPP